VRRTLTLPGQRDNPVGAIALKRDARFDRGGLRGAGAGEELVAAGRIQRAHITGLVKRHELRLAESAELVPHLHIDERVRSPLIDARVLTKSFFIDRLHDGSLTRGNRVKCAEKRHDNRRADRHSPSGSSNHLPRITPRTAGTSHGPGSLIGMPSGKSLSRLGETQI
jgi:hypothetical protein